MLTHCLLATGKSFVKKMAEVLDDARDEVWAPLSLLLTAHHLPQLAAMTSCGFLVAASAYYLLLTTHCAHCSLLTLLSLLLTAYCLPGECHQVIRLPSEDQRQGHQHVVGCPV